MGREIGFNFFSAREPRTLAGNLDRKEQNALKKCRKGITWGREQGAQSGRLRAHE